MWCEGRDKVLCSTLPSSAPAPRNELCVSLRKVKWGVYSLIYYYLPFLCSMSVFLRASLLDVLEALSPLHSDSVGC